MTVLRPRQTYRATLVGIHERNMVLVEQSPNKVEGLRLGVLGGRLAEAHNSIDLPVHESHKLFSLFKDLFHVD